MIEQSRTDHIKTSVDLKAYIEQATGSAFKKNGKGYVCRCHSRTMKIKPRPLSSLGRKIYGTALAAAEAAISLNLISYPCS